MNFNPMGASDGAMAAFVWTRRRVALCVLAALLGPLAGCASRPESGFLLPVA
jgi:hypothetical protein